MSVEGHKDVTRVRRAYRGAFAASVCLAAIGAPILMQGAVALVTGVTRPESAAGGLMHGLLLFGLSAIPMILAALAWRRTQSFQATLDEEP
jgi:hypothetical protein